MPNVYMHLKSVQRAAGRIRTEAQQYRQIGQKLIQSAAATPGWYGADAEAFRVQLEGFQDNLEAMAKLMETYAFIMEESVKGYRQIQDAAVSEAKRLW